MNLCVGGTAEVLVNGYPYVLSKGSLYVVTPLVQMCFLQQSGDFAAQSITGRQEDIFPAVQPLFKTLLDNEIYRSPCTTLDPNQQNGFVKVAARIEEKRRQLAETESEQLQQLIRQIMVHLQRVMIMECLQVFLEKASAATRKQTKGEEIVFEAIRLMVKDFRTEHGCEYYASRAGLSPNHFTHVVKRVTGHTPKEWLQNLLVQEAKIQLSRKGVRVQEVADALNFPDQFTFSRFFKTQTGMSPRAFQKE